jgi:hypothetical protein
MFWKGFVIVSDQRLQSHCVNTVFIGYLNRLRLVYTNTTCVQTAQQFIQCLQRRIFNTNDQGNVFLIACR